MDATLELTHERVDDATLELTHERVDDVPMLLGFLCQLRLPEILDRHFPPHPLHQGLSNGWLISVWIVYILSQADHRKSHVQAWVESLGRTFESLLGQTIRPVEFNDDRLTLVLRRLSDLQAWHVLEADLWSTHCDVYALPVERVRLDATTSYGYHATDDDGLMQLGHSKDHRPDLPQFKLMAAAAEPTGLLLAADVYPGNAADDPLYLPLYRRVRKLLRQTGLLYTGDCKMAALETRAEIAATGDYYLTRLPLTGTVQAQFAGWVEAAVTGAGDPVDRLPTGRGTPRHRIRIHAFANRPGGVADEGTHLDGAGADPPIRASGPEPGDSAGSPAGEGRGGPSRPDSATRARTDPVHNRLGTRSSDRHDPGRTRCRGTLGSEPRVPGNHPDALRGSRSRRPQSPPDHRTQRALPDHDHRPQHGGDRRSEARQAHLLHHNVASSVVART